jgi:hypothetical protein
MSKNDETTKLERLRIFFEDHANQWIKGRIVSDKTGIPERALRDTKNNPGLITKLIPTLNGETIISSDDGYKMTSDPDEVDRYYARLMAHATSEMKRATLAQNAITRGQMRLPV